MIPKCKLHGTLNTSILLCTVQAEVYLNGYVIHVKTYGYKMYFNLVWLEYSPRMYVLTSACIVVAQYLYMLLELRLYK